MDKIEALKRVGLMRRGVPHVVESEMGIAPTRWHCPSQKFFDFDAAYFGANLIAKFYHFVIIKCFKNTHCNLYMMTDG